MVRRKVSLTSRFDLGVCWSRWLLSEFGDAPSAIGRAFGVTRQTAATWLDGQEPRGRHLARALVAYPGAAAIILGEFP